MGELGERVGVVAALAFAAAVTAVGAFVVLAVADRSLSGVRATFHEPAWLWMGGLMGLLIVFSITLAAPRIGTAATVGFIIAGNLVMAAAIDRFGLFGQDEIPLSWPRLLGIALLAVGAGLSLSQT